MAEKCLSAMQALALMAAFKDEWPCLIIVPSSLRGICLHFLLYHCPLPLDAESGLFVPFV